MRRPHGRKHSEWEHTHDLVVEVLGAGLVYLLAAFVLPRAYSLLTLTVGG